MNLFLFMADPEEYVKSFLRMEQIRAFQIHNLWRKAHLVFAPGS